MYTKTLTINVTVTDKHSNLIKSYSVESEKHRIEHLHNEAKKVWSEYWVNFKWNEDKDFIFGIPYEMELDEKKLLNHTITFEDYEKKWYPKNLNKQSV